MKKHIKFIEAEVDSFAAKKIQRPGDYYESYISPMCIYYQLSDTEVFSDPPKSLVGVSLSEWDDAVWDYQNWLEEQEVLDCDFSDFLHFAYIQQWIMDYDTWDYPGGMVVFPCIEHTTHPGDCSQEWRQYRSFDRAFGIFTDYQFEQFLKSRLELVTK